MGIRGNFNEIRGNPFETTEKIVFDAGRSFTETLCIEGNILEIIPGNMNQKGGSFMAKTVIGIFRTQERATEAIDELKSQGFDEREISLVAREKKGEGYTGEEQGFEGPGLTMKQQDLREGLFAGGALGGLTGLLAGAGALLIPGIGPIIAAGPLASFLTGIVGGGLVGGLVDFGIPEAKGRHLEERVKRGDILVSVKAEDDEVDQVTLTLERYGAEDVEAY